MEVVQWLQTQKIGDKKGGVIWHTQGSGKSLSMVFYTGKIVLAMDNPTVLIITDRNDLDDQLFDTFASAKQLLRQEPKQVDNKQGTIKIALKYDGNTKLPVIQSLERVSRPGLRTFAKPEEFKRVKNGLGIAIISTSKGVMTDKEAKAQNVGGEVLCNIY